MKTQPLAIDGPLLIEPERVHDLRGFRCVIYNAPELAKHGIEQSFLQDNHLLATAAGTVEGPHFQRPPAEQAKLIRVIRGAIFAVAIDLRSGSTTYGKHVSAELSAENALQIYVPEGFASGFATLRPLTEISCRVSQPNSPQHEAGLFWDDPALRIRWPVGTEGAKVSVKDRVLPLLAEIEPPFPLPPQADAAPLPEFDAIA